MPDKATEPVQPGGPPSSDEQVPEQDPEGFLPPEDDVLEEFFKTNLEAWDDEYGSSFTVDVKDEKDEKDEKEDQDEVGNKESAPAVKAKPQEPPKKETSKVEKKRDERKKSNSRSKEKKKEDHKGKKPKRKSASRSSTPTPVKKKAKKAWKNGPKNHWCSTVSMSMTFPKTTFGPSVRQFEKKNKLAWNWDDWTHLNLVYLEDFKVLAQQCLYAKKDHGHVKTSWVSFELEPKEHVCGFGSKRDVTLRERERETYRMQFNSNYNKLVFIRVQNMMPRLCNHSQFVTLALNLSTDKPWHFWETLRVWEVIYIEKNLESSKKIIVSHPRSLSLKVMWISQGFCSLVHSSCSMLNVQNLLLSMMVCNSI